MRDTTASRSHLGYRARSAMALLAVGGAAAVGLAAQDAHPSPPAPPAPERPAERHVEVNTTRLGGGSQDAHTSRIEVRRTENGDTVVVRRSGGRTTAEVNGKPADVRLEHDGRVVVVIDDNGDEHRVGMPQANALDVHRLQRLLMELDERQDERHQARAERPRVMLGVVMGEPDAVLIEHLGLDAGKVVLLERVIEGLPADKAGLEANDIVVGFGEHAQPRSADEIRQVLREADPGEVIKVKVLRKGQPRILELKLEAFNPRALGRGAASGGPPRGMWRDGDGDDHRSEEYQHALDLAEDAMRSAAKRLEELAAGTGSDDERRAHEEASRAIEQAIKSMQLGQRFGLDLEDFMEMQRDAFGRMGRFRGQMEGDMDFLVNRGREGGTFELVVPSPPNVDGSLQRRLEAIEGRLEVLEGTLRGAVERLEDRLSAHVERLIDRLERLAGQDEHR